ncbi:MAG: hypothetical protein QM598_05685 [Protaetiibacter sp.]
MQISERTRHEISEAIATRFGRLASIADVRGVRVADLIAAGMDVVIEAGHKEELVSELRRSKAGHTGIEWTVEADDRIRSAGVSDRRLAAELGVSYTSVGNRRRWLEKEIRTVEASSPETLEDGTLALPCGTVWEAEGVAQWRSDHLPGCGICLGNFGSGKP